MDSTEERDGAPSPEAGAQPDQGPGADAGPGGAEPALVAAQADEVRTEEGADLASEAARGESEGAGGAEEAKAAEPEAADQAPAEAAAESDVEAAAESDVGAEVSAAREASAESGEAPQSEEIETGIEERPEPAPMQIPHFPEPPRKRHHVAPALVALDHVLEDETFRIRPEGDLSLLATDIARLGQLFPIDIRLRPPDRFQIICGFRRVAALKFLQRDRVLARLHTDLTDEDALLMALVSAIHARPVEPSDLERIRLRFENDGRLTPSIRSMIEKALSPEDDLGPELVGEEEEVEAEALAEDVTFRLGAINQDLSLLADVFDSLDRAKQEQLLEQLRYSSELVAFLEARR